MLSKYLNNFWMEATADEQRSPKRVTVRKCLIEHFARRRLWFNSPMGRKKSGFQKSFTIPGTRVEAVAAGWYSALARMPRIWWQVTVASSVVGHLVDGFLGLTGQQRCKKSGFDKSSTVVGKESKQPLCSVEVQLMGAITNEANQFLSFDSEIATACLAGLAMTTPQITSDRTLAGRYSAPAKVPLTSSKTGLTNSRGTERIIGQPQEAGAKPEMGRSIRDLKCPLLGLGEVSICETSQIGRRILESVGVRAN